MRITPATLSIMATVASILAPAGAQLPPQPNFPDVPAPVRSADHRFKIVIPERPSPTPVILHVAPGGSDRGDGSTAHPFATLPRAQAAVRTLNRDHDVTVSIAPGTYRLGAPLVFTPVDGGQNGYTVRWQGAEGARPILSGGVTVGGWRLADRARGIWSAPVPAGADPRQFSVNGRLAPRAAIEIPRAAVVFPTGGSRSPIPPGARWPSFPIRTGSRSRG